MALEKRIVIFGQLQREGPELDVLLNTRGFRAYGVAGEEDLLDVVQFSQPDVVLLLGQPDELTLSRLVTLNQQGGQSLVAVMWPGAAAHDIVQILETGADYVTASFHPDLLASQLRAYLRRIGRERSSPNTIELGYLRIDLQGRQVTVNDREVSLTRTEFDVLRILAERPGTVLPSGEIMQQVLGVRIEDSEAQDLLKVHVHRLRQKLEQDLDNPRFIRTVRGHGYMYAFERRSLDRSTDDGENGNDRRVTLRTANS